MNQQISAAGVAMIEKFEGLKLRAYRDVAGVFTIGYGHIPATERQMITQFDADRLLDADISDTERTVNEVIGTATDGQFAAMVSLCFNIGNRAFLTSSVLREHKLGNFSAAGAAFLLWDKAHVDGKLVTVVGLLNRRETEKAMYLG
jgi:lysozyme